MRSPPAFIVFALAGSITGRQGIVITVSGGRAL